MTYRTDFYPLESEDGKKGTMVFSGVAITVELTNAFHIFPTDPSRVVTDFTDSGTDVHVYEGTTELSYDGVGTDPGTYTITLEWSAVSETMTIGSITDNGDYPTIGDHSGTMNNPSANLNVLVEGVTSGGISFSFTRLQKLYKSFNTGVFSIVTDSPVIVKDAADATTSGSHSTLSIWGKKREGDTVTDWGWLTITPEGEAEGTVIDMTASPPETLTPANGDQYAYYTLKLYDDNVKTTLMDTATIEVIYKGDSASVLTLSSTAQAITFDGDGNASPSSQTIIFTANLENLSGTATFTAYKYNSSNSYLGAITLGRSGNTRTLTNAQFSTAHYVIVTATIGSYSDTITITRVEDGTNGADGNNSAVVYLYKRSASSPSATMPTGTFTYTFSTGVLSGGTSFNGWTQTIPTADGNPLWVTAALAYANTATDSILGTEFVTPVIDSGAGVNQAQIRIYQRASSTPSKPSNGVIYTFSTGALSGTSISPWSLSVPTSNGNPLYTTHAIALSTSSTDTIDNADWATVTIEAEDGADAKVLVVEGEKAIFTFDGNNNLDPGTQSVIVTANPQNFVGGNVVWSYSDNLGTASATLATYVTATSANVRTVNSTMFTSSSTRTWVKVTATGQGVESGYSDTFTIVRLEAGSNVLTVLLSNDTHGVPTDSFGNSGDFSEANGQVTVYFGTSDVTGSATISEYSETNCTGTTTAGGYYSVTAMSADTATYTIRVQYNPGDGVLTVYRDFTLVKNKKGKDAVTVTMSNEAHSFNADFTGAITDYTGSGTTIKVKQGNTDLTYVTYASYVGTAGTWTVNPSSITKSGTIDTPIAGDLSGNGTNTLTVGVQSGMTSDAATITYPITIKTFNSDDLSFSKTQTFTRQTEPTPVISPVLSNFAHSFTQDANGNVASYTGSGTTIRVLQGDTYLTYRTYTSYTGAYGTWTINPASITKTGTIDTPIAGDLSGDNTTTATVGVQSGFDTAATITYPIQGYSSVGGAFSFSVLQSFSLSSFGIRGSKHFYVDVGTATAWSDSTASNYITVTEGLTLVHRDIVTQWTDSPSSGDPWAITKYYNANTTSWVQITEVIDGGLLVNGSVTADAIYLPTTSIIDDGGGGLKVGDISAATGTFTDGLNITGEAYFHGTGTHNYGVGYQACVEINANATGVNNGLIVYGNSDTGVDDASVIVLHGTTAYTYPPGVSPAMHVTNGLAGVAGFFRNNYGSASDNALGGYFSSVNGPGLKVSNGSSKPAIILGNGASGLGSATTPSLVFGTDTNTGLWSSGADTLDLTTGGTNKLSIGTTAISPTIPLRGANGSAAAPTYSFTNAATCGLYYTGTANTIALSTNSTQRLTINTATVTSVLPFRGANGFAAAPTYSFTNAATCGLYYTGTANTIALSTNSTQRLTINNATVTSALPLVIPASAGLQLYFGSDIDTGLYYSGANNFHLRAGGINVVDVNGSTGAATFLYPIRIASGTPASASATGTVGQFQYDSTYLYICIATNTWRRVAHATW